MSVWVRTALRNLALAALQLQRITLYPVDRARRSLLLAVLVVLTVLVVPTVPVVLVVRWSVCSWCVPVDPVALTVPMAPVPPPRRSWWS